MDKKYLDEALYGTYSVSGKGKTGTARSVDAMCSYIRTNDARMFSNANGVRTNLEHYIDRRELADYLAKYFVDASKKMVPQDPSLFRAFSKIIGAPTAVAVEKVKSCLLGKQNMIAQMSADDFSREVCKLYAERAIARKEREAQDLVEQIRRNVDPQYGVKNVRVNMPLVNACRTEVLNGGQIAIQNHMEGNYHPTPRRDYNLNDEMFAVTDLGKVRNNQEDSVLILYHPQNPQYKLLVVADGMGGVEGGEIASQEIVRQMTTWFESLNPAMMLDKNNTALQQAWTKKLNEINAAIAQKSKTAGSTFVGAIVGESRTTVASIGDSRCYALGTDNELYQLTVDDNPEYLIFQYDVNEFQKNNRRMKKADVDRIFSQRKDTLRFNTGNNGITNCLGCGRTEAKPKFVTIPNDLYRSLMLFSDGVTDCLSDENLLAISRQTSPKDLARVIVNSAITTRSVRPDLQGVPGYRTTIEAGKDNTTAAVLHNKSGEER